MNMAPYARWPKHLRPRRSTFEKAGWDRYVKTKCYRVGVFAAHRSEPFGWMLSHAATGLRLPGVYGETLVDLARVARSLHRAIDWSRIKRGTRIGHVDGLTKRRAAMIRKAIAIALLKKKAGKR